MSCTAEEIAEKRRIALERLKNRKLNTNTVPHIQSSTMQSIPSNATSPKSIVSFYGNTTNVKTNQLSDYENKIKKSPTNKVTNRILSQPYPTTHDHNSGTGASSSMKKVVAPIFTQIVTCTCSLVTPNRFQVVTSGYMEKLIDVFKSIPSRAYSKIVDKH